MQQQWQRQQQEQHRQAGPDFGRALQRKIDPAAEVTLDTAGRNAYHFRVPIDANKVEIRQAVEKLFNVKVRAVNTQVRKGKMKMFKNIRARQTDTKRAIVTLEEGHTIDVTTGL